MSPKSTAQLNSSDSALRQAAQSRAADTRNTRFAPPEPWPRTQRFHTDFFSITTRVGFDKRSVEQLSSNKVFGAGSGPSSAGFVGAATGGIAVSEKPLQLILGVAPDAPNYRGVAFEVAVCATDERWSDGIAIGFTAENPDRWPEKKAKPKRASQMPRTWVCGYGGRWYFERRSEFINYSNVQVRDWKPSRIECGDVVTAVAVSEPKAVLRILLNGRVVAEEPLKRANFPDVLKTPLWGIVDLNGTCMRVALTESGGVVSPTSSIGEKELFSRGSLMTSFTRGFNTSPGAMSLQALKAELQSGGDGSAGSGGGGGGREEEEQQRVASPQLPQGGRRRPATMSPRGFSEPEGLMSPAFLAASSGAGLLSPPAQRPSVSSGSSRGRRPRSQPPKPGRK